MLEYATESTTIKLQFGDIQIAAFVLYVQYYGENLIVRLYEVISQ